MPAGEPGRYTNTGRARRADYLKGGVETSKLAHEGEKVRRREGAMETRRDKETRRQGDKEKEKEKEAEKEKGS